MRLLRVGLVFAVVTAGLAAAVGTRFWVVFLAPWVQTRSAADGGWAWGWPPWVFILLFAAVAWLGVRPPRWQRWVRGRSIWPVLGLGLGLRLGFVALNQAVPYSDFAAFVHWGQQLARQGSYDGWHNHFPVGTPAAVALVAKLGLDPVVGFRVLNAVASAAISGLLYGWLRSLGRPSLGWLAGFLWAIYPGGIVYVANVGSFALFSCFFVAFFAVVSWLEREPERWRWAVLAGLLIGLSAYVRAEAEVLPLGLALLMGLTTTRAQCRQRGLRYGMIILVAALCLLPWGLRNLHKYGRFWTTTSSGGYALYIGNNPKATGGFIRDTDPPVKLREIPDKQQMNQAGRALALAWITEHPWQYLKLIPKRWYFTWRDERQVVRFSTHEDPYWQPRRALLWRWVDPSYVFLVLLAGIGALRSRGWGRPLLFAVAGGWLFKLTVHVFFHGEPRYHLMLMPSLMILAAQALLPDVTAPEPQAGEACGSRPAG